SFMPDFTSASAIPLIMSSLTLQPNLFQLFQPMGGVSARLAEGASWMAGCCCAHEVKARNKTATMCRADFIDGNPIGRVWNLAADCSVATLPGARKLGHHRGGPGSPGNKF